MKLDSSNWSPGDKGRKGSHSLSSRGPSICKWLAVATFSAICLKLNKDHNCPVKSVVASFYGTKFIGAKNLTSTKVFNAVLQNQN